MPKEKKLKKQDELENGSTLPPVETPKMVEPDPDMMQVSKKEWTKVQETLKMLTEVADKGRVFNYESSKKHKNPIKVKLSKFNNNIVVGWRTVKDELIKHPTTGKTVGEQQEYELILLGKDDDGNYSVSSKVSVNGYNAFSDIRYGERIDAEVVGKKEDYEGNVEFDVMFPDGKKVSLNSRFVN